MDKLVNTTPDFNALQPTLSEQIAEWLANEIVSERLAPGERINEYQLAQRLGTSRGPLREAIRILKSQGLISLVPRRGAIVTQLSEDEVSQLFDIRIALVGLAARLAATNCDEAMAKRFNEHLAAMHAAIDDPEAYAKFRHAVGAEIIHGSGNAHLAEMIESFALRIGRYGRLGLLTPTRRAQSFDNWTALIKAIIGRDPDEAERRQRKLATANRDEVLRVLRERREA